MAKVQGVNQERVSAQGAPRLVVVKVVKKKRKRKSRAKKVSDSKE